MMEPRYFFIIAALVILFVILFGERIRKQYGSLKPDGKVTERFERYEVNPDLIYYTSGPEEYPDVIIGVDLNLVLDSTLWKKRELTPETMKILVTNMQSKVLPRNAALKGFEILDKSGNYIGEWFSVPGIHTTIDVDKGNRVRIFPPSYDVYDRD